MSANLIIRPGVIRDAGQFHKLDLVCFPPETAFTLGLFRYHLKDPYSLSLVAETVGANRRFAPTPLVGFILAQMRGGVGNVLTMDVNPDHRRMGIGRRLLMECEKAMVEKGARLCILQVAVNNSAAISLYESAGYRHVGKITGYYPHPLPNGTDAFFLEKKLQ